MSCMFYKALIILLSWLGHFKMLLRLHWTWSAFTLSKPFYGISSFHFHKFLWGSKCRPTTEMSWLLPVSTSWDLIFFCTFISTFKRSSCITCLPQALLINLSFGFFSAKMKKFVLQFSLSEQYFSHSEAFSVALFLNSHPIFIILLKTQTSQETPAEIAIPFCSSCSNYHQ